MSNQNNSFTKISGTSSIFVKTFSDTGNSSSTSFRSFYPMTSSSSSSNSVTSVSEYDTLFKKNVTVEGTLLTPSDVQLKKNIQNIPSVNSDKLMDICPVTYELNIKNELKNNDKHYGFIAQDMEHIFPELVQYNDALTLKTINYLELIPLMIAKMQKMQMQIDELMNK
jgi:hypothetical protein